MAVKTYSLFARSFSSLAQRSAAFGAGAAWTAVVWSWGCVSAVDSEGRTIWIVDAHRDDGKRFVARSDEKLTAFVKLESVIRRN
jgi:hypothetical protein